VEPHLHGALGPELGGEGGSCVFEVGFFGSCFGFKLPRRDLVGLEQVALLVGVGGEGGVARGRRGQAEPLATVAGYLPILMKLPDLLH
jgi:hypothetical protein